MEIAGRARTLAEARTLLATVEAEVALLDLRLPDGSGTDLLSGAGDAADGPAFIVLSTFQTPQYVAAAVALGASGFVAKTAPTEDIVDAVRVVADGGTAFPREMARPARNGGTRDASRARHHRRRPRRQIEPPAGARIRTSLGRRWRRSSPGSTRGSDVMSRMEPRSSPNVNSGRACRSGIGRPHTKIARRVPPTSARFPPDRCSP